MNNLAKILNQYPFSQAELSQSSFVSQPTINSIYNNEPVKIRQKTKVKITNGLNKLCNTTYTIEDIFPAEVEHGLDEVGMS